MGKQPHVACKQMGLVLVPGKVYLQKQVGLQAIGCPPLFWSWRGEEIHFPECAFLHSFQVSLRIVYLLICVSRDFPGRPVVRVLCFHCREHGLWSLVGEIGSHMPYNRAKKKKKKKPQNSCIHLANAYWQPTAMPDSTVWALDTRENNMYRAPCLIELRS